MGKYLTSFDGTRLYYTYHKGKKPLTLVFLHGVGANWTVWRKEIDYFRRRGYSTLAPDFRGHGKSDMPEDFQRYRPPHFSKDIHEILQEEKITHFALIGHSLGGAIAINYCMLFKDCSPSSLVLVESTATYPFAHDRLFNLNPFVTHFLRFIARHDSTRKQNFFHFGDVDLSHPSLKEKVNLISHLMHLTPLRSIVRTLDNVEKYVFNNKEQIDAMLRHLNIPTLLIAGEFDRIIPPKYSKKIQQLDKKAEFQIIKGAHHRIIINHPERVCQIIEEFVGRRVAKV